MSNETEITIPEHEIRAQLQSILTHPDFAATPQRKAFLTYIVGETLAGRAAAIKGVSIAMSVFDRDETFDQQVDPIVRLEARRLRQNIDGYYAGPGRDDPIRISIPKGGYVPRFEAVTSDKPAATPPQPAPTRRSGKWIMGLSAAVVVSGLLAWFAVMAVFGKDEPLQPANLPKGPVIAVLPFAPLGEGPGVVADGITQQLTTELVRFRDLWVLPLGSVQRFRDETTDLHLLKKEFGADFVLEGSVMEAGDSLKISARLVDLETDRYIWVRSFVTSRSPSEIYDAQDEITHAVIGNLAGKYGILAQNAMKIATRTPPESRSAYDCVLQYYGYQITIDLSRHGAVKACIERAVKLDPGYAEAWAVLSNLYLQQIRFDLGGDRSENFRAADAAARRAVKLDPYSAFGHLMLANMRFAAGDMEGFRQAGEAALELNPNDTAVLAHYGMRLAFGGDWEDGLALVDRAIALNPVHPHWHHFPQVFYLFDQREYQQALAVLDQIDMPGFFWTHLWRAALNAQLDNHPAAGEALENLLRLQPDFPAKADDILSIWQLSDAFKEKLILSLREAGLSSPS